MSEVYHIHFHKELFFKDVNFHKDVSVFFFRWKFAEVGPMTSFQDMLGNDKSTTSTLDT